MAPRGRGGSSSSGSPSHGGSEDSASSPSPWIKQYQLAGTHFKDSYVLATIVVQCTCFLALLGIAIWSLRVKSNNEPSRKVFRWCGFGLAISVVLISIGLQIADRILAELAINVSRLYIIMYVFIEWWALKADIILLGVVYFVTTSRVEQMGLSRGKSYPALRLVHGAVGAILFVTFLVSMYFFVRFLVLDALLSEADFYRSTYAKLDAAFYILYFIAAIEVLTWATIIFVRSHNAHIRSKIGLYLLTLVATPLLVRSSIAVGLTLKYKLLASQPAPAPRSVALVEVLFRDIAVVVIFAGILLIGLQKGWSPAHYGVETLDVPTEGKAPRLQVNTTREVSSMTVKEYPSSTPLWVNTQWAQQSNPAQLQWADHHKRRG